MRRLPLALVPSLVLLAACDPGALDDDDSADGEGPGTAGLAGQVVSYPEGEPIPDMSVVAFDVQARYEIVTTDGQGRYEFAGLAPTFYRVKAWPIDGQNFIGAYFNDMYFYCTGEILDLRGGGALAGVDFRLPHGGGLSGTITTADSGLPLENARIDVRGLDYYNANLDPTTYTDADGAFQIVGLDSAIESLDNPVPVAGNYELKVTVPGRPVFYWPGVYTSGDAEPVGALRGEIADGVDLALPPGGEIVGRVTDADGNPATSGSVQGRNDEETWMSVTVGLGDDGEFSLSGLAPGPWSLEVRADGLAATATADPLQVAEDGWVDGVEFALGPQSTLSGTVSGPAGPVADVTVTATPLDDGVDGTASSDEDGEFTVTGLAPGEYVLHLRTSDDTVLSGYLCGSTVCEQSSEDEAVTVGVSEDIGLGIVALPAAALIEGRVVDRESGVPLGRIYVTATAEDGVGSHLAVSDDEGVYTLGGLAAGTYWLVAEPYRYCGGDPGWVTLYSGDGRRPEDALRIQVGAGGVAVHDLALPRDHDGDGMADLWEVFHMLDPARDDSLEDPDLDGILNIDEYLEDGDPREDLAEASCSTGAVADTPMAGAPAAAALALALAVRRRRGTTGTGRRR